MNDGFDGSVFSLFLSFSHSLSLPALSLLQAKRGTKKEKNRTREKTMSGD